MLALLSLLVLISQVAATNLAEQVQQQVVVEDIAKNYEIGLTRLLKPGQCI